MAFHNVIMSITVGDVTDDMLDEINDENDCPLERNEDGTVTLDFPAISVTLDFPAISFDVCS